ncbi:MAG: hypothetical protein WEC84_03445 [Candidatus Andersenbacteria bacterium]
MPEYWMEIRKQLPVVLIAAFVAGAVAYALSARIEPVYEVHFSYIVSLTEREEPGEYTFDGFYALQATDLFTATVAKWAQTPEVIVAAFNEAGIPLPTTEPHQVSRIVRADKTAPQLIQVSVRGKQEDTAMALAEGLQSVMERNIERYDEEGIPALQFRATATDAWVGRTAVSVPIISSAAFLIVAFLGLNLVVLLVAMRAVDTVKR